MSKRDIFNWFEEAIRGSIVLGEQTSGPALSIEPVSVRLTGIEPGRMTFILEEKTVELRTQDIPLDMVQGGYAWTRKSFLFWLSVRGDKRKGAQVMCLSTQTANTNGTDSVDFGFGDDFIRKSGVSSTDALVKQLRSELVFEVAGMEMLLIQRFKDSAEDIQSDTSFVLRGWNKAATVIRSDDRFEIKSLITSPLTRQVEDFKQLTPFYYEKVIFTERSKAREAHFAIDQARKEGRTLLDLWKKYGEIERERCLQLKTGIGELRFEVITRLRASRVRVRFVGISDDQRKALNNVDENTPRLTLALKQATSDGRENKGESALIEEERFDVLRITDKEAVLEDYDKALPDKGVLQVSIKGTITQQKRRDRALKKVTAGEHLVLRNLNLVIEGSADAMLENTAKNHEPETSATTSFLNGLKLTENQREAVHMALNSDICLIQGPPGTGKSTVVSVICQRLLEQAERDRKFNRDKVVLLSAFQNDTVDHVAGLVRTNNMPTLRIGRESESSVNSVKEYANEIRRKVNDNHRNHVAKSDSYSTLKKLKDIKAAYLKEKDQSAFLQGLKAVQDKLHMELRRSIRELSAPSSVIGRGHAKIVEGLQGLPLTKAAYGDGGYDRIDRLLHYSGIKENLTPEEVNWLDEAPPEMASDEFLNELAAFQLKYLMKLKEQESAPVGENMAIIDMLDQAIDYCKEEARRESEDEDTFIAFNLEDTLEEIKNEEWELEKAIRHYSEVVAATNQVAGSGKAFELGEVDNVILEEAARSNPLDLLIPMARANSRIILVGDHKQLPQLLERKIADELSEEMADKQTRDATKAKLEESLFEVMFNNLLKSKKTRTITLSDQFRMHKHISDFISRVYYEDTLKPHPSITPETKAHGLSLSWAKDKVAVFYDVSNGKELKKGTSWTRPTEADRVISILKELWKDPRFDREDGLSVGIITFYAGQRDIINDRCLNEGFLERDENGGYRTAARYNSGGKERFRVGSVDAFQGKEFDVVILSTVRSNGIDRSEPDNAKRAQQAFGFLMLDNRLNVAFSRAKSLIITVGDMRMFTDGFAEKNVKGLHEFATVVAKDQRYGNIVR